MSKTSPGQRKRVAVSNVRLGMFIDELCGSWMDHPFWNTRSLLENPNDLDSLRASAVGEVWIDTSRGLDVAPDVSAAAEAIGETDIRVEAQLLETLALPQAPVQVELAVEVQRAAAVCGKARNAITAMFGEARMGKAVDTEALMPLVDDITGSVSRNPGALISLARLKRQDDYTYMHSVAVCGLMVALSRQLGLDAEATREAGLAGLIHDLGKALVPLEVLNKPGKLTDAEFALMKEHPKLGYDLLLEGGAAGAVPLDVCLHHHEKVDGSGYPERLSGERISLFAKMGAVCDVYDAITSDRPYKAGWDPGVAIRKMNEWSNGHFDSQTFQAFVKTVGIYPIGSLVRLESGLLAVVVDVAQDTLLKPQVKAFYCTRRRARIAPRLVDLAVTKAERIASWEDPAKWPFPDLNELWSGQAGGRNSSAA